jgi:DNA-binding CsgD family transcriptional regulator
VLERGLGVAGYEYGLPPDGGSADLLNLHVASGPTDFADRHMRALSTTDPEVLKEHLRPGCAMTGSENVQLSGRPQDLAHYISHVDYCKDALYLTAVDCRGAGVAIVSPLAEVTSLSPREAERWQMLAAHVEAGHRLRRSLAAENAEDPETNTHTDLPHDTEAIFDATSFRVTDAVGPAQQRATTQKLREAALRIDRARGPMRKEDPEGALETWRALVRGRWSIVDWFDSDGRRFVLAIPNAPEVTDPRGLTEREGQVVAYAVQGHTNKIIAYRLGLSASRVSAVLHSAMRKLKCRSRSQLVKEVRMFQGLG